MTTDDLPNELWTSAETAKFLGMRQARLLSLAARGKIPGSYKAGHDRYADWRFDADKIRAYKKKRDERAAALVGTLNAREAAKFIKRNEETIRRLTREGQIPAVKNDDGPRAEWRYQKADLKAYLISRSEVEE